MRLKGSGPCNLLRKFEPVQNGVNSLPLLFLSEELPVLFDKLLLVLGPGLAASAEQVDVLLVSSICSMTLPEGQSTSARRCEILRELWQTIFSVTQDDS